MTKAMIMYHKPAARCGVFTGICKRAPETNLVCAEYLLPCTLRRRLVQVLASLRRHCKHQSAERTLHSACWSCLQQCVGPRCKRGCQPRDGLDGQQPGCAHHPGNFHNLEGPSMHVIPKYCGPQCAVTVASIRTPATHRIKD